MLMFNKSNAKLHCLEKFKIIAVIISFKKGRYTLLFAVTLKFK